MKNTLKSLAEGLGIYELGVVRAEIFNDFGDVLKKRGSVNMAEPNPEKRINPFLTMPEVKSIIVCLFPYHVKEKGNISSYAFGQDYHLVIKEKLTDLSQILIKEGYIAKCFADTGALSDRHLAFKAGLGFHGKNGMFINERLGSWFFIGYIMTSCILEPDTPLVNTECIGCGKCLDACPSGAVSENYGFNESLCVSYITQKKGQLEKWEENLIKKSGYIWGCDICQNVCPHNINILQTNFDEFKNDLICNLDIDENISNKKFKELYKNRAFSWRGKKVLIRNQNLLK